MSPARAVLVGALLLGAAFAGGLLLGMRQASADLRGLLARQREADTVGGLLSTVEPLILAELAQVYLDPAAALRHLAEITWTSPVVPAPFVGYVPAPGLHGTAAINARQLRSTRELLLPKPAGVRRVFFTGGSTAFGCAAPSQEETIGSLLEARLVQAARDAGRAPVEVFTAAAASWASTHERILIENRLSEWEPDLIVALSGFNDAYYGAEGRDVFWLHGYGDEGFRQLVDAARAACGQPPLPVVAAAGEAPVPPSVVAERLEKNVRLALAALSPRRVPYVFVLQPALAVTAKALSAYERRRADLAEHPGYFRECYAAIAARLRSLDLDGFTFVDATTLFDDLGAEQAIFLDSSHFGDRGNRRVAEFLERVLAEHHLLELR